MTTAIARGDRRARGDHGHEGPAGERMQDLRQGGYPFAHSGSEHDDVEGEAMGLIIQWEASMIRSVPGARMIRRGGGGLAPTAAKPRRSGPRCVRQ